MPFSKSVLIVAMIIAFESVVFAAPGAVSPLPPITPAICRMADARAWLSQAGLKRRSYERGATEGIWLCLDFRKPLLTKSDDGRTLKIRAARFADASGAFGAYTFYLQPAMSREEIGERGASADSRVLFYRGHIVVDVLFNELSVISRGGIA